MDDTKSQSETQMPRQSKLAVASLLMSLLVPCFGLAVVHVSCVRSDLNRSYLGDLLFLVLVGTVMLWGAIPTISVAALIHILIHRTKAPLKGWPLAIAGLCIWVAELALLYIIADYVLTTNL